MCKLGSVSWHCRNSVGDHAIYERLSNQCLITQTYHISNQIALAEIDAGFRKVPRDMFTHAASLNISAL